jgi:hypothetical protein
LRKIHPGGGVTLESKQVAETITRTTSRGFKTQWRAELLRRAIRSERDAGNGQPGIRVLLQFRENRFLVRDDGIERRLVFQNCCLILFDRLLIRLDLLLVGDNRGLIGKDLLLVCDIGFGHVETPSELNLKRDAILAKLAAALQ